MCIKFSQNDRNIYDAIYANPLGKILRKLAQHLCVFENMRYPAAFKMHITARCALLRIHHHMHARADKTNKSF